jgi:hypothetical protein
MSSSRKVQEAKFFLELLNLLEERRRPLTLEADATSEASYLLSAVMNSLYSAVEIMKTEGIDVKAFRDNHGDVYARAANGGIRAKTVHVDHVDPSHVGYIPPSGKNLVLRFHKPPRLLQEERATIPPGRADLHLGPDHYITLDDGRVVRISDFCHDEVGALIAFRTSLGLS